MNEALRTQTLLDLSHTRAASLLEKTVYPWEALAGIGAFILALGPTLPPEEFEQTDEAVWVAKDARLFPNHYIAGPCIIGHRTEVRPGAFIRGNALVGDDCVVGNSTELKNVILFDTVQVPHYNYVGDSVLGYKSHMGAGAITSNVKQDKTPVTVAAGGEKLATGLKKFGAVLGDHVEIGCNTVLTPGSVVGRGSRVYPLSMVRGFVPAGVIYKRAGELAEIRGNRTLPDRARAEALLEDALLQNPGPWGEHSRVTARCAERLAAACPGMDADKAYVLGLLHDIGRRFGKGHLRHAYDGWKYMLSLGYDEVARVCLTHSFNIPDISLYNGNFDVTDEQLCEMKEALARVRYDDYDRLVQVCDTLADAGGVVDMETRMADVKRRYGGYSREKWDKNLALKRYFEEKTGRDIYAVVRGEREPGGGTA